MSKKFKGNKSLKKIRTAVLDLPGGRWCQQGFDRGEDWINFAFMFEDTFYRVLFNTVNGTFITNLDGALVTERNTEFDDVPWYAFLLELIYEPLEAENV